MAPSMPAAAGSTVTARIDPYMTVHHARLDPLTAAVGNASAAHAGASFLPGGNPALVHVYHRRIEQRFTIHSGYGRDSLFAAHAVPAGFSMQLAPQLSGAIRTRYLVADDSSRILEGRITLSGRLFERSTRYGAINYGITLRADNIQWQTQPFDTLYTRTWLYHTDADSADILDSLPVVAGDGMVRCRRIVCDAGIYQREIAPRLDFGLTVHNAFGYRWTQVRPYIDSARTYIDTPRVYADTTEYDTVRFIDSLRYIDRFQAGRERIPSYQTRVGVGICAYRNGVMGSYDVAVPIDLQFIGVFDNRAANLLHLHAGVRVDSPLGFSLYGGYAREARLLMNPLSASTVRSRIYGGTGLRAPFVSLQCYVGQDEFGTALQISF